jgi:hypothetical protein
MRQLLLPKEAAKPAQKCQKQFGSEGRKPAEGDIPFI